MEQFLLYSTMFLHAPTMAQLHIGMDLQKTKGGIQWNKFQVSN